MWFLASHPRLTCHLLIIPSLLLLWASVYDKLPHSFSMTSTHTHTLSLLIFTFTSSQCQTKPWKLLIIFSFFVWFESNKDPFLFDVIKLLRLDLGVRVNFSRASRGAIRKLQMSGALSSFTAPRFSSTSHKRWGEEGVRKNKLTRLTWLTPPLTCCPTPPLV